MAQYLTTQHFDRITYRGKASALVPSPLEGHPDRQVLERIGGLVRRTPRLRRGYIGRWAIEDGKVMLVGVDVRTGRRRPKLTPLPLDLIFPEANGPVHAAWVDGVMLIGRTRGLLDRLGVPWSFTPETILAVDCGMVESALTLQTAPNASTIGRLLQAMVRRLLLRPLSRLFPALPSKLRKIRLRRHGSSRG